MRHFVTVLVGVLCVCLGVQASEKGRPTPEEQRAMRVPPKTSPQEQQILNQIRHARESGDVQQLRGLEQSLMQIRGIVPQQEIPYIAGPLRVNQPPEQPASPGVWGGDVLVRSGSVFTGSIRNVATDYSADGTIYTGVLLAGGQSLVVDKSTDNGLTWQYVQSIGIGSPWWCQGFSMHVTDDTSGTYRVGLVLSVPKSATTYNGSLFWVSFNSDGGAAVVFEFAPDSPNAGFRDPSVVSDGFTWAPGATYWYAAAAMSDSFGNTSGTVAFRSVDFGLTWPFKDTVRALNDDMFPTIDYKHYSVPLFFSRRANLPIPDNNPVGVADSMFLPLLNNTRVLVRIDTLLHTWVGDLIMKLVSPRGDTVRIMNRPGTGTFGLNADNFIGTILVDSAARSIDSIVLANAPFTGFYRPDPDTLTHMNGEVPEGYWKLMVSDNAGADVGTLVRWSLFLEPVQDEVYVSFLYHGNVRVFRKTAEYGGTSFWPGYFVTDAFSDNYPDLAVSKFAAGALVAFESSGAIYYCYSTQGYGWSAPLPAAPQGRHPSVNIFRSVSSSTFRIAYSNLDSVLSKTTTDLTDFLTPTPVYVNQFSASDSIRPAAGSHIGDNGHVVYAAAAGGLYYDGSDISVGVGNSNRTPTTFSLSQNYPNPFNPATRINYTLGKAGLVTLKIYNILGQEVSTLVNGQMQVGVHSVTFDAASLATGIYFYKLQAGEFVDIKKMVLIK